MKIKRPLCFISILFVVIIIIATKAGPPQINQEVLALKGKTITFCGEVKDRRLKNGSMQVYIQNVNIEKKSELDTELQNKMSDKVASIEGVILYLDNYEDYAEALCLGRRIIVKGVFNPFSKADNEGQFDQMIYYKIRGYDGSIKRARLEKMSNDYNVFSEKLRRLREEFEGVFETYLSQEDCGVMNAMILGDKSNLDNDIKEQYQNAGISHLLALSGLHIAAVGLALSKFLKKLGLNSIIASIISGVIITIYAYLTGFAISTQRALIMFVLANIASIMGRTYDLITAAGLSSIIILTANPYYIYDSGFLLSFLAVVGIGLVHPILYKDILRIISLLSIPTGRIYKTFEGIIQSLCASFSITISTLPVIANSFYQISIYSIFLNLIVIPLMSIVLLTGFAGGILGLAFKYIFSKSQKVILLRFIFTITHFILEVYKQLSDITRRLKGNIFVIGKPLLVQTITYVIIVALLLLLMAKSQKTKGLLKKHPNKITLLTIAGICFAFYFISINYREIIEIRNISVGQGDCSLICGKNLPVIMIDGGSSDIKEVGKYRVLPTLKANGIATVDYCILTHLDMDHISAVLEMLSEDERIIGIERIIISKTLYDYEMGNGGENFNKLMEGINRKNTELILMSPGDVIDCNEVKLRCIYPGKAENTNQIIYSSGKEFDPNENSLVISLEVYDENGARKFNGLFTGDIGQESEKKIIDLWMNEYHSYTYLKVAHHGSRNSSAEDFINLIKPQISVISAGVDNSYGHPHKETLEKLEKIGSRIYRTDEKGEVILKIKENEIEINTIK